MSINTSLKLFNYPSKSTNCYHFSIYHINFILYDSNDKKMTIKRRFLKKIRNLQLLGGICLFFVLLRYK